MTVLSCRSASVMQRQEEGLCTENTALPRRRGGFSEDLGPEAGVGSSRKKVWRSERRAEEAGGADVFLAGETGLDDCVRGLMTKNGGV